MDQLAMSPVFTSLSSPVKIKLQCFPDLQRYYGEIFSQKDLCSFLEMAKKGDLLIQQFIK